MSPDKEGPGQNKSCYSPCSLSWGWELPALLTGSLNESYKTSLLHHRTGTALHSLDYTLIGNTAPEGVCNFKASGHLLEYIHLPA